MGGGAITAPAVAGVIAVWLSQDEHKARLQVPGQVAANVKKMVQDLAYPRFQGGPAVIWNGIDPRGLACSANANVKRQAQAIASSLPSATTATPAPTSAPPPTVSAPSTAKPPLPPKPQWSENPAGFTKAFEKDGVASAYYDATSDSASEGVTDNIEQWCLAKCTGSCVSLFLYRELQLINDQYNIYFICNQYNQKWSDNFVQNGVSSADSAVVFTKS
ncbi:uncharacterized protein LY79DRAFT_663548 [Colletotrichum navitas]|uniref:Uncharacterized protein n=1 Tax=Colletotrichum navitas TaxID=681940 RepID=A0AAD8UZC2_9PEZI|nr:uncharacterized protein LY79DRAFT_663548 [Colletotrichum navitas]KAK1569659.1 hypothetical protein LY79DRAFT_663548 [Colletotrichum navitas]